MNGHLCINKTDVQTDDTVATLETVQDTELKYAYKSQNKCTPFVWGITGQKIK